MWKLLLGRAKEEEGRRGTQTETQQNDNFLMNKTKQGTEEERKEMQ